MPVAGRDETFTAFFSEVAARSVRAAAAPIRNSRLVGDMLSFCLNPKPVITVDSPPLADVLRSPIDFDKLPRETPAAIRNELSAEFRELLFSERSCRFRCKTSWNGICPAR